jgi:GT2 family glycosyltransferase
MDPNNLIAIIALNFNKRNEILDRLKSIFNLEYPEIEAIVAENGLTDGSPEAIKSNILMFILLNVKIWSCRCGTSG